MVGGAYVVHPDMKNCAGAIISLGKGAVYAASLKKKNNTKSSTEMEVVSTFDILPQVVWKRYFLDTQDYEVKESIMYQDKLSVELLENNGKRSSSKRTRHMNI